MTIDWWTVIWEGLAAVVAMWAKAVATDPLPWIAILGLAVLGWLVPTQVRRRRR